MSATSFRILIITALQVLADRRTDEARLGTYYTSMPLYRSGAGTNILPVGIGSPPQQVNLTLSKHFVIALDDVWLV
jgi:hypothetical protein